MSLVLKNASDISVEIRPEALALRDNLVAEASGVVQVQSQMEQEIAIEILRELKKFQVEAEGARADIKKPVLDAGRLIDSTAKALVGPLSTHADRIQKLVNEFQRQMEAEAEAERRRIQREAEEVERKAREAREEAERKAREAANAAEKAEAEARLQRVHEEASQAAALQASALAAAAPSKVAGTSTPKLWKFEVTDPKALYAARPDLVFLEPIPAAIHREIKSGMRDCPGLRIYEEVDVRVRAKT